MYKTTSQLKKEAKATLKGRWKDAILLNLVPSLLQILSIIILLITVAAGFYFFSVLISNSDSIESMGGTGFTTETFMNNGSSTLFDQITFNLPFGSQGIFSSIFNLFISFLTIGISFTFLDAIRKGKDQSLKMSEAFRLFNGVDFVPVLVINILIYIFQMFWGMLFLFPALIKHYSYSQSNFIYKDLSSSSDVRSTGATTYITESRQLMNGHKARLFWLDITFIGWYIVGYITFGIGFLFINPYVNATKAAFYNDLAKDKFLGTTKKNAEEEQEWTTF